VRPAALLQDLERPRQLVEQEPSLSLRQHPLLPHHLRQWLPHDFEVEVEFLHRAAMFERPRVDHGCGVDEAEGFALEAFVLCADVLELLPRPEDEFFADE